MAKIKPMKPGTETAKKPTAAATTESRQTKGISLNRNESRQTKGISLNRNESRQTRRLSANRNESLARR